MIFIQSKIKQQNTIYLLNDSGKADTFEIFSTSKKRPPVRGGLLIKKICNENLFHQDHFLCFNKISCLKLVEINSTL